MNQNVLLGVGAAVIVLLIVAIYFIVTAPSTGATTSKTTVIPGSGGRILSHSVNPGPNGVCSSDAQCRHGSECVNGTCTVHECNKCVPYGTVGIGNTSCLDYWTQTENKERMLDETGDRFNAPIDSHMCENFHPLFELETPAGACSVSFSNRCQQTS